jgi:hypothetical protein
MQRFCEKLMAEAPFGWTGGSGCFRMLEDDGALEFWVFARAARQNDRVSGIAVSVKTPAAATVDEHVFQFSDYLGTTAGIEAAGPEYVWPTNAAPPAAAVEGLITAIIDYVNRVTGH